MQTQLNLVKKSLLENAGFEAAHQPILNLLHHKEIVRFFTGISVTAAKIKELIAAFSSVEGMRVETKKVSVVSFGLKVRATVWRFYYNDAPFAALMYDSLHVASLMVIPGVTEKVAVSGSLLDAASEKEQFKQSYIPFFYSHPAEADRAVMEFCTATAPWAKLAKTQHVDMEPFATFGPLESGIFSRTISFDSKTKDLQGVVTAKHEPIERFEVKRVRLAGEFIDNEIRQINSYGLLIGTHQGFLGTYQYFYEKQYSPSDEVLETRTMTFRVLPAMTLKPIFG